MESWWWCGGWRVEKKCEKLLKKKKKRSSKFFWTEILEVGLRAKKRSPNIPASRAPKLISPYALGGAQNS
jgi:hypothetical protein